MTAWPNWQPSQFPNGTPGTAPAPVLSTYEEWKGVVFSVTQLMDPAISGDQADPDGDGKGTLFEYAFVGDPHAIDRTPGFETSTLEIEGVAYQVLAYRSRPTATDLEYTVEFSSDLQSWTTVDTVASDPVSNFDGSLTNFVRTDSPLTSQAEGYFRVLVKITP